MAGRALSGVLDTHKLPTPSYVSAISDQFPRTSKERLVESSIESKAQINYLPHNATSNGAIQDSYLEFRIPGEPMQFLDLTQLVLDLKIKLVNHDGTPLGDKNAVTCNGLLYTLFRNLTIFF